MLPKWMWNSSRVTLDGHRILSMEDAYKLDDVREALRRGDAKSAIEMSKGLYAWSQLPFSSFHNRHPSS